MDHEWSFTKVNGRPFATHLAHRAQPQEQKWQQQEVLLPSIADLLLL